MSKSYLISISFGDTYEQRERIELVSNIDGVYRVARQGTLAQKRKFVYTGKDKQDCEDYISNIVGYDITSIPF